MSSNHAEILSIHEASQECVWLRSVIQHIRRSCGISSEKEAPTVLNEDNAACIAQLKEVRSSDNLAGSIYQGTSYLNIEEAKLQHWDASTQRNQVM